VPLFFKKKSDALPTQKAKLLYYVVFKKMGNPPAKSSEKWADAEEGRAGSCCLTPNCCIMRTERLVTALGGLSTGSLSELAVELLPLSISLAPSLSKTSPSSKPS
jgi:hypothetical protein